MTDTSRELLTLHNALRNATLDQANAEQLARAARKTGGRLPRRRHPRKTLEELYRQLDAFEQRRLASSARNRGAQDVEHVSLASIIERHGLACYLCGGDLTRTEAQVEHIIPLSRGGTHTASNVALACQPCNMAKSARIVSFDVATRKPAYAEAR